MMAKFGVLEETLGVRLRAEFRLDRFTLSTSDGESPQILSFVGLRHFVVSPIGGNLRKMNMGAQLQTFPSATVSKLFLYFNAFMAKSGAQSDVQKSDGQTDRQTNRQTKNSTFLAWRRMKSEPHQFGMVTEDLGMFFPLQNFWGSDA